MLVLDVRYWEVVDVKGGDILCVYWLLIRVFVFIFNDRGIRWDEYYVRYWWGALCCRFWLVFQF